jgi:hypothetical protein
MVARMGLLRRATSALALLGLMASAPVASAGNPWEDLFGPGKGRAWSDPQGRFSVELPAGWEARTPAGRVELWREHRDSGYVARVTVQVRSLPPGVSSKHLALRVRDETRRGSPGYRSHGEERRIVGGVEALLTHFTYQEQGNAALVNDATQVVLVAGERGFVLTLEVAAGTREVFGDEFDKLLASFSAGGASRPESAAPGTRRRLKAGEMVDPEGVPY